MPTDYPSHCRVLSQASQKTLTKFIDQQIAEHEERASRAGSELATVWLTSGLELPAEAPEDLITILEQLEARTGLHALHQKQLLDLGMAIIDTRLPGFGDGGECVETTRSIAGTDTPREEHSQRQLAELWNAFYRRRNEWQEWRELKAKIDHSASC